MNGIDDLDRALAEELQAEGVAAGEDGAAEEASLYFELAQEDQKLFADLVECRARTMTQEQMANKLGLSQATISAFERLGNDPKFSTVRRYAAALGVMVIHHVDEAGHQDDSEWTSLVSAQGVTSAATAAAIAKKTRCPVVWDEPTREQDAALIARQYELA